MDLSPSTLTEAAIGRNDTGRNELGNSQSVVNNMHSWMLTQLLAEQLQQFSNTARASSSCLLLSREMHSSSSARSEGLILRPCKEIEIKWSQVVREVQRPINGVLGFGEHAATASPCLLCSGLAQRQRSKRQRI